MGKGSSGGKGTQMIGGIPEVSVGDEGRVAALGEEVAERVKMGCTVLVETNAGKATFNSDEV